MDLDVGTHPVESTRSGEVADKYGLVVCSGLKVWLWSLVYSRGSLTLGHLDPQGMDERIRPRSTTVNTSTPTRTALGMLMLIYPTSLGVRSGSRLVGELGCHSSSVHVCSQAGT